MKVMVLGVQRMSGVSKKTGNDYDMTIVYAAKEAENVSREGMQRRGAGYQPVELRADSVALEALQEHKFPSLIDLENDSRISGRGMEMVVTGVKG